MREEEVERRRQLRALQTTDGEELTIESAEQALDSGGFYVATALSHWRASYDFRYTNGETAYQWVAVDGQWTQQPRPKLETFAGTFAFGVDGEMNGVGLCWYLDSNFCSNFHKLKAAMASPSAARALMLVVFIGGARTQRPTPPPHPPPC